MHRIRQVAGLLAQYKTGCRFTGYWHGIRQVAGFLVTGTG